MTEEKIKHNKISAIQSLDKLLEDIYETDPSKTDKISYWIKEYVNYLNYEKAFKPDRLIRYKRGDIIKVNLGFRIGAELGGLHYCVVLNNFNSIKAPLLTIVPLSSLKDKTDINNLPQDRIYLGDELYDKINDKVKNTFNGTEHILNNAKNALKFGQISPDDFIKIKNNYNSMKRTINKTVKELSKMKHGSVAVVGQIMTVSKMRIYDPVNTSCVLHGIRLSNTSLDLINQKIKELYIYK